MSRFPVRWSELLLFSVFSCLFVNWNSAFHTCSVLQCKVPLCFYTLTPTLCFHCFLLSFLCSFSPCLPPPPTHRPLLLSLRLRLSASAVLSCAVCLVLQGQDRAVLTGTSPEQCETEGGRHRNWVKEGRAGEICAYPSGLDKQLKTTGPFLLFSVAEGGDSATRWMAARTELHAGKIRGQKTLFVISRYSQRSPLFCFEFRGLLLQWCWPMTSNCALQVVSPLEVESNFGFWPQERERGSLIR